ncbi:response regulator [Kribbella sp. NBC_00709]|uniref:response regulator n=1 Tax=Kribbella sp. NBC_00709 TaxID=2975972 RepID=UPI003FA57841
MRVVIADDSALLREGLARLLAESGVEVCETVADATGLVEAVDRHHPDVAIVDIRMPPTYTHEGAAAAIELRDRLPALGILLLSQAVETHYASQLLRRHAERFGYLLKDRVVDVETLMGALRAVSAGGMVLDPEIVRHLMRADSASDPLAALTERERDVLALMAEGRVQLGDRETPDSQPQNSREPHREHLQQARSPRSPGRPPPRPRRTRRPPRRLLAPRPRDNPEMRIAQLVTNGSSSASCR